MDKEASDKSASQPESDPPPSFLGILWLLLVLGAIETVAWQLVIRVMEFLR